MKRNGEDRACKYCGNEFHVPLNKIKEGRGIYCSKECYHNDKKGEPIICRGCGEEFRIAKSLSDGRLYCSHECRSHHLEFNKKPLCRDCGVEITKGNNGRCRKCALIARSGEGNHRWSGGLHKIECDQCGGVVEKNKEQIKEHNFCSPICQQVWQREVGKIKTLNNPNRRKREVKFEIRKIGLYEQWRRRVFERDGYKCANGCEDNYVEAHHKKTFDSILQEHGIDTLDEALECEELWNTDNGVTLCKTCHKKEHKKLKVA